MGESARSKDGNCKKGKGSTVAGVAFAWKTLLCWCSEDVELASTATDLGFLSFIGCFSLYAITEQFRNTRTFLLQDERFNVSLLEQLAG